MLEVKQLTTNEQNKNFYPTPRELAMKMLEDVQWNQIGSILEPSAGKGDLIEVIEDMARANSKKLYCDDIELDIDCIEFDKNLQYLLKGKGYKVVFDNFLVYNTHKRYDLIVMNPFYRC